MSKLREAKMLECIDEQRSFAGREKRAGSSRDIESRAYDLWLQKGCPEGSAEEDWLRAERETESQDNTELVA